jgi:hypothetical protein
MAILTLAAMMLVGCASHPVPAQMVNDPTTVSNCEFMGIVLDPEYVDLAQKAGKLRGTHAVIVREQQLGAESGREYVAEVYRCSRAQRQELKP